MSQIDENADLNAYGKSETSSVLLRQWAVPGKIPGSTSAFETLWVTVLLQLQKLTIMFRSGDDDIPVLDDVLHCHMI